MKPLHKGLFIGGIGGLIAGWFFHRQIERFATDLHLPRPRGGDVGFAGFARGGVNHVGSIGGRGGGHIGGIGDRDFGRGLDFGRDFDFDRGLWYGGDYPYYGGIDYDYDLTAADPCLDPYYAEENPLMCGLGL